jgi:transcriptional regulator with XRE-family HTH domain
MLDPESTAYAAVLGRVIAALREKNAWTQAELAEAVGSKQSTISRIESGQALPDAFTFRKIATALGRTPDGLQALVERAFERTQRAAEGATGRSTAPWWQSAWAVAGAAGLVGLAAFAVAALVSDEGDAGGSA